MPCPHCSNAAGKSDTNGEWVSCNQCGLIASRKAWNGEPTKGQSKYPVGTHGAKKRAQTTFGTSGSTHQSEHPIGYAVAAQNTKRGDTPFAKNVENFMGAYQEDLEAHRDHKGTGSGKVSDAYRDFQRALLEQGQLSAALQYNQLEYASMPQLRSPDAEREKRLKTADRSYEQMVLNFGSIPLQMGSTWKNLTFTPVDKAEGLLARQVMRSGTRATKRDELAAMKRVGMLPSAKEELKRSPSARSLGMDTNGVWTDGNCLFHAVWLQMQPQLAAVSVDDLRRMAVGFLALDPDAQETGIPTFKYRQQMSQPGVWGGELEAWALAHTLGVRIVVDGQGEDGPYTVVYNGGAATVVSLRYDGSHYTLGGALGAVSASTTTGPANKKRKVQ